MRTNDDFDNLNIPWLKIIGGVLVALVLLTGLGWFVQGNDFFMYKYFAPKQAAVERQVFEQTPSYVKGMVQELENMQVKYVQTDDPDAKATIAGTILHRASGFNLDDPDVSADLRGFIERLRRERLNGGPVPTGK